jgi:hypothetical protein
LIMRRHARDARNASVVVPIRPSVTRMYLQSMNRAMTRTVAVILEHLEFRPYAPRDVTGYDARTLAEQA